MPILGLARPRGAVRHRAMQRLLRHPAAYLAIMCGFIAFLFFAGGGRTKTLWGFQRRINIRLQQLEPGIFYDNRAEGLIVAKGDGVFEFIDLAEPWERYQAGEGDIDSAAAQIARRVTNARLWLKRYRDIEDLYPFMIALPIPRSSIHPMLTEAEAASEFVVARGPHGLPFYAFVHEDWDVWFHYIVRRHDLPQRPNGHTPRDLVDIALANVATIDHEWTPADDDGKRFKLSASQPVPRRSGGDLIQPVPALALLGRPDALELIFEHHAPAIGEAPVESDDVVVYLFADESYTIRTLVVPRDITPPENWYLRLEKIRGDDSKDAEYRIGVNPSAPVRIPGHQLDD